VSPGSSDPSAAARRSLAPPCSGLAREQDLDPAGSAGSYEGFALVEIPLPWPREITEATVEVARLVPVPDCGKPVLEAKKSAPELRVSGFAAA
jgi:hypothetical protein